MQKILIQSLGDLHPLAVHLPIGILALIALFNLLIFYKKINIEFGTFKLIHLVALMAIFVAIVLGIISENTRTYSGNDKILLEWHEKCGYALLISFAIATYYLIKSRQNKNYNQLYYVFFCIAIFVLSIGGHLGGVIVHGEISIIKKIFYKEIPQNGKLISIKPNNSDTKKPDNIKKPDLNETQGTASKIQTTEKKIGNEISFIKQVYPIFDEHCVKCHGPEKQKGELRLDMNDYSKIVTPFDPNKSKLIELISLPPDHEDIMPPKDGPLSPDTIQLITEWVKQGAIMTN